MIPSGLHTPVSFACAPLCSLQGARLGHMHPGDIVIVTGLTSHGYCSSLTCAVVIHKGAISMTCTEWNGEWFGADVWTRA